jgi:hypothetical protein
LRRLAGKPFFDGSQGFHDGRLQVGCVTDQPPPTVLQELVQMGESRRCPCLLARDFVGEQDSTVQQQLRLTALQLFERCEAALGAALDQSMEQFVTPEPQLLALRLRSQQHQQRLMRWLRKIDPTVRLRQPQLHTVRLEYRKQPQHLVAAERPLVLSHHHGVEGAVRIGDRLQQHRRLRPVPPGQSPTTVSVEELRHDPAVVIDEVLGDIQLPPPRRDPLLEVSRGHPPVEGEPQCTGYVRRPTT